MLYTHPSLSPQIPTSAFTGSIMDQPKVALQQIIGSLHSVHGILENIFDRVSDGKADRICERFYLDPNDGLKFLALEAKNIHQLATEIESNLSGRIEMQRKDTSRMESKVSSLMKENQEIRNMLKVAITEKEAAENSIHTLKGDKEEGRSSILQIAEKGLHKVGFGFIMEVISAEPASQEPSTSGSTVTSNRTENEHEHISLVISYSPP
jgi:regulator of replication initiation timing